MRRKRRVRLATGNASKQLHWLRRAADGGHINAMMILWKSILDRDHDDFIKQTLEMTEKDGMSYLQKAADKNCGDAVYHSRYFLLGRPRRWRRQGPFTRGKAIGRKRKTRNLLAQ